jgi:GAF domain-containing protein
VFYVTRHPGADPFGSDAQEQLEAIAPYAAAAMSNATLLERERLSAATAWALADAARQLQQAEHAGQVAPMIADALERLCQEATGIYVDPRTDRPSVTRGVDGEALAEAVDVRALEAGDTPHIDDAYLPERQTVVAVGPMVGEGQITLAVALPFPLDEHRIQGVQALLGLGTVGLASAQQREAETELQRYQCATKSRGICTTT